MLAEVARRRTQNAVDAARRLQADLQAQRAASEASEAGGSALPSRNRSDSTAYDASNDCLVAHLETSSSMLRAQILADTLIQFRAHRRTQTLIDHRGDALVQVGSRGRRRNTPRSAIEQPYAEPGFELTEGLAEG